MDKKYWENPRSLKDPLDEIDLEVKHIRSDISSIRTMDEYFGAYGTGWVWQNEDGSAMTLEEAVAYAKKEMPNFEIR